MKLYTITLNPAYDVHVECADFKVFQENFPSIKSREAGGKGVNISRALNCVGIDNTAIIVIGKENADEYCSALKLQGLKTVYLEKKGRIRENLTLHHGGKETRISFSGFVLDDSIFEEINGLLSTQHPAIVTFTGSIPKGITTDAVKRFLLSLKNQGVKIVLDSRSFELQDIREIGPWLIKPNMQELSQWFETDVSSLEQASKYAKILHHMGVENAMVSMGNQGAVLACGKQFSCFAPSINAVSTIGAGDSSLAGFISAYIAGEDGYKCLKTAVAFGSAACLTEGTNPPKIQDIQEFLTF